MKLHCQNQAFPIVLMTGYSTASIPIISKLAGLSFVDTLSNITFNISDVQLYSKSVY